MTRIEKFNKSVLIIVTLISYYLIDCTKSIIPINHLLFNFINVIISFLLSSTLSSILLSLIYRNHFLKKILLGKRYIEGIWVLMEDGIYNDLGVIEYEIAEFKQIIETDTIEVVIYSVSNRDKYSEYYCVSKVAKLLGDELNYYNYYTYIKESKIQSGIATGQFIISHGSKYPDRYNGLAMGLDDGFRGKEFGWKMKSVDIKKQKKMNEEKWLEYLFGEVKLKMKERENYFEKLHNSE